MEVETPREIAVVFVSGFLEGTAKFDGKVIQYELSKDNQLRFLEEYKRKFDTHLLEGDISRRQTLNCELVEKRDDIYVLNILDGQIVMVTIEDCLEFCL